MRFWMVDPKLMCQAHLTGEHRELHAVVGLTQRHEKSTPQKWPTLRGLMDAGCIDLKVMESRHAELVAEMERRQWPSGIFHQTPLAKVQLGPALEFFKDRAHLGVIDREASAELLFSRCAKCRARRDAASLDKT